MALARGFFLQETRKAPLIFDLRADPFEVAPEDSSYYEDWLVRHMYVMVPVKNLVGEFMGTFKDFPPAKSLVGSRLQQIKKVVITVDRQKSHVIRRRFWRQRYGCSLVPLQMGNPRIQN